VPGVVGDVPGGGAVVPVDGGTPVVTGGTVETVDSVTDGGVVVVTVQRKQTRHGAMGRVSKVSKVKVNLYSALSKNL